jgi:hypothetical protein
MIEFGGMSNGNTVLQYSKIGAQNNVLTNNPISFKLYPNPAKNQINIELTGNDASEFQVFDAMGRLVHTSKHNSSQFVFNTELLKTGQYWVKIIQNENISNTTFIKY